MLDVMSELWRQAYISRSAQIFAEAELCALEKQAQALNVDIGLTGLLLFDGQGFAQALEGDRAAVVETMQRIKADRRHTDVTIVSSRPIRARQFDHWSMKVRSLADASCIVSTMAAVEKDISRVRDSRLRLIFHGFAECSRQRSLDARAGLEGASIEARALKMHLDLLIEQAHDELVSTWH